MFHEISPAALQDNPFTLIGSDWLLVSAGTADKANAMTASWGGVGIMWGKPSATIYIRPQRFTKTFLDSEDRFALSIFTEDKRAMLRYMGTVSGANEDKIGKSGLTLSMMDGAPAFEEARLVLICRKQFAQAMDPSSFINKELLGQWYPEKDYHTMYIAEIEHVYVKD